MKRLVLLFVLAGSCCRRWRKGRRNRPRRFRGPRMASPISPACGTTRSRPVREGRRRCSTAASFRRSSRAASRSTSRGPATRADDEPRAFCMPSGFPSAFLGPYPVQLIQNARTLVMVTEFMRVTRIIPLDGRPHQADIEPTYYGDPVGKWEGDTLVIDTTHFKRWSLDDFYYANPKEYRMHSDAFHTIERLTRVDANTIKYDFTVDDPKIFTRPWTENWEFKLHPEWDKTGLYEMVCNENNRCPGGQCAKP